MAHKSNCVVNGKPKYRLRTRIGTNADGKPIYKSFYGDGKSEAQAKLDAYLRSRIKSPAADRNDSFLMVADHYTYNILPNENLSFGTIELYERQYRNIVSKQPFCIMPIKDLRKSDIQQFCNLLSNNYSQAIVQATSKYLKRLFKWLDAEGYCDNFMSSISIKTRKTEPSKTISTFTDEETQTITSTPNRLQFFFLLAFATGMRLGELLAIRYSDFNDGSVTVSRQLNEHYIISAESEMRHESSIIEPKSKSSNRTIPLPRSVVRAFEHHRSWHKTEMLANGYRTEYLFTSSTGHLLSKGNFRRAWTRHLKSCGIEYRKFHSCRATYCTMLCRNGVPLETASKLMGHANVSVTAKYYRLISDDELRDAVEKIDSIFQPVGDKLAITEK